MEDCVSVVPLDPEESDALLMAYVFRHLSNMSSHSSTTPSFPPVTNPCRKPPQEHHRNTTNQSGLINPTTDLAPIYKDNRWIHHHKYILYYHHKYILYYHHKYILYYHHKYILYYHHKYILYYHH